MILLVYCNTFQPPKRVITINPKRNLLLLQCLEKNNKARIVFGHRTKKKCSTNTLCIRNCYKSNIRESSICDRRQIYPRKLPISPGEIRNNPFPPVNNHPS
ncbi:hypothetical protein CEXT_706941 [Caerostris extrusa]|uniref:Uncharacterized protein n=1 Tax=Caerostris extrusa TaxID=172846 RepID=A0AAV4PN60_CAEEX|nr:hypothetical protein CEXT_706941 [Caerostris extrusa]